MDPVIEIVDGAVSLGGRPVLRGISLTINEGEVVAILGANGSGKSTLVRATMGLVPIRYGQVKLFGDPLEKFHDWKRIGFVPQRVTAAAGVPASVWEVVASGRLSRRPLLLPIRKADRIAVDDAIEAVGLAGKAKDGVSTLSGGQQQRALIARALAGQPDVFVLDEPTAGVDKASQQAFARTLELLVDRGATIVLVAHELGPMAPLIGRTIVMRDGRVAYDGQPIASDHEIENSQSGHGHHHRDLQKPDSDYTPVVSSPIDRSSNREGRA